MGCSLQKHLLPLFIIVGAAQAPRQTTTLNLAKSARALEVIGNSPRHSLQTQAVVFLLILNSLFPRQYYPQDLL